MNIKMYHQAGFLIYILHNAFNILIFFPFFLPTFVEDFGDGTPVPKHV